MSVSDLVRLALPVIPQTASESTARRLIERAIKRDRGRLEFDRPELYFPKSPAKAKSKPLKTPSIDAPKLYAAEQRLRALVESQPLTAIIWNQAFLETKMLITDSTGITNAKLAIIELLWRIAPGLSKSRGALQRNFNLKYCQWIEAGERVTALKDRRNENGGRPAPEISKDVEALVLSRALNCGGRLSQAWRELIREGKLPPAYLECYGFQYSKSLVPRRIRTHLTPMLKRLMPEHIGPKAGKLQGPKLDRDWSGMPSGVQAQSDDCTLPVYFWVPDENGLPVTDPEDESKVFLTRGQFLPWIDTRTGFIYCFQLLPRITYSSEAIMRGVIRMHDEYGLPDELYFEQGIWKNSLMISGRRATGSLSLAERAYGLADLGINVIHALDPSAKVVEGLLGSLQNYMERERGYCGREERVDFPESSSKALSDVRNGKVHPSAHFYSYPEWLDRLAMICDSFNDEPQQGKRLQGLTPRQGFYRFLESPLIKLGADARHLLAFHRREIKVSKHGARIRIGKNQYLYTSEATGRLQGEKVLAWYSLEDNQYITLTDLKGHNPVTVGLQ